MNPIPFLAAFLLAVPAHGARPAVKGLSREEAASRAARVSEASYRLQFVVGFDEALRLLSSVAARPKGRDDIEYLPDEDDVSCTIRLCVMLYQALKRTCSLQ